MSDAVLVSVDMLRRYLIGHGWQRSSLGQSTTLSTVDSSSEVLRSLMASRAVGPRSFDVYSLPGGDTDTVEIVLPLRREAADFARRIEQVVDILSELEGRDREQVVADVKAVGFDVVRSRILDTMVYDDAVHLEVAANYIIGVRKLLASAATTELQPAPYFERIRSAATQYADKCRFGHTFRGSFGFTIESPVEANIEPALIDSEETPPFGRQVMQRFAHAVHAICDSVDEGTIARLTDDVGLGFGANAYEQFANLIDSTAPGGMTLSFTFSPEWKAPFDLSQQIEYLVDARHVEATRLAAKALRKKDISRQETIIGRVERLQSSDDPSNLAIMGQREISIQWSSQDLGTHLVRIAVTPDDYLAAIEAHKAGQFVRISGVLVGRGKSWQLINPGSIEIL